MLVPSDPKALLLQAVQAHRAGQLQQAERLYRALLQRQPRNPDANHNLGQLLLGAGQASAALPLFKTALDADPRQGPFWLGYVEALRQSGQTDTARAVLAEGRRHGLAGPVVEQLAAALGADPAALARTPGLPAQDQQALQTLKAGRRWTELERLAEALAQRHPGQAQPWSALATARIALGRPADALEPQRRAAAAEPGQAAHIFNLGNLYTGLGRLQEALPCYQQAIQLSPGHARAHANLGALLLQTRQWPAAEEALRRALQLQPDDAGSLGNLATLLLTQGRPTEAEAAGRQALALCPDEPGLHNNLAVALIEQGRFAEAEACCRQALALNPGFVDAHSNLIFALNYREDVSPQAVLQASRDFGQRIKAGLPGAPPVWRCSPDAPRLRLGFVSGDLRRHPVGYFLHGLLKSIDRSRFELLAYSTQDREDELTAELRGLFEAWVPVAGLSDDAAAARIRDDAVHVLIDLAGHTALNRLPLFARRPAPLQVAWLGYFATTGLTEIDAVLGDPQVTPPQEESHFVERIRRLPETYLCFTPPSVDVEPGPLPAQRNGYVTFANFGNLAKLGDAPLALWARVLKALPQSRLLLKTRQLADPQVVQRTLERFAAQGIAAERLQFEGASPRADYLACYRQVDLVLDTFPFPGGTTSVEALWMGVPVLTRRGDRFVAHNGETIAVNAGQAHWIAADDEAFVARALQAAADLDGLAQERAGLRARLLASPLCDAPRFARHFEAAVEALWAERRPAVRPAG